MTDKPVFNQFLLKQRLAQLKFNENNMIDKKYLEVVSVKDELPNPGSSTVAVFFFAYGMIIQFLNQLKYCTCP